MKPTTILIMEVLVMSKKFWKSYPIPFMKARQWISEYILDLKLKKVKKD